MNKRAIFLDRDGTVSEEVGYVNHIDRYHLLPRSAEAIRRINDTTFLAFLVTNQSGIARGLFDESLLGQVHQKLMHRLEEAGAHLDGIYFCPHHPGEDFGQECQRCDCRKPLPGMLARAASEHGVDLSSSYMIGDTMRDLETARNAGATGILVLTGYGKGEMKFRVNHHGLVPAHVAVDLLDAVEWIIHREESS